MLTKAGLSASEQGSTQGQAQEPHGSPLGKPSLVRGKEEAVLCYTQPLSLGRGSSMEAWVQLGYVMGHVTAQDTLDPKSLN